MPPHPNSRKGKLMKAKVKLQQLIYRQILGASDKIHKHAAITIVEDKVKGYDLVAVRDIPLGDTVAWYRAEVKAAPKGKYESLLHDGGHNTYQISVYDRHGEDIVHLTGDLGLDSFPQPCAGFNMDGAGVRPSKGVPFWGPFVNEPVHAKDENVKLLRNTTGNYKSEKGKLPPPSLRPGDYVNYPLIATKIIKKNKPIAWCYGPSYDRDYQTACDGKSKRVDDATLQTGKRQRRKPADW